jgi:hypothetical protein
MKHLPHRGPVGRGGRSWKEIQTGQGLGAIGTEDREVLQDREASASAGPASAAQGSAAPASEAVADASAVATFALPCYGCWPRNLATATS